MSDPTPLQFLGLLIGLPVLVIVVVFAIARVGNVAKARRDGGEPVTDAVWLGGRYEELEAGPSRERQAIESAAPIPDSDVGGAGARW